MTVNIGGFQYSLIEDYKEIGDLAVANNLIGNRLISINIISKYLFLGITVSLGKRLLQPNTNMK